MSVADEPTAEQPISRAVVLDARFGRVRPAERVEVREIRIRPGHAAGRHVHNGPVVGSIVEGSVVFQVEGEPERILRAGDVFYEPEGTGIARFDPTDEGVRFLGYFILGPDEQPEIAFPEA
jgi:quercetin dioxygenase-like cupin family protein